MDPSDPLYRYHRQTLLPGVGVEGQRRLAEAHAVVVGLGALGCPAADLLARAGVGRLTLIDRDVVELTNLQRQTLYTEEDAAAERPKAEAARRRLAGVNASVKVEAVIADVEPRTAEALVLDGPQGRPGVLLDCVDNFETRFLLNDLAVKHGIPLVYGGAIATRGVSLTVRPGRTACLRCLFEAPGRTPGETCDTVGVLGPVATMIGAYQASEAVKALLGMEERLSRSALSFDLWTMERSRVDLCEARDASCVCCGGGVFEFLDSSRASRTVAMCGQGSVQVRPGEGRGSVDLAALASSLQNHGTFSLEEGVVRGELHAEPGEDGGRVRLTVFSDGRAIVGGTTDPTRARGVYARYIGG
ncbi:MAG: ThiF family adenylyltransferase [Phycisphaerales bacterium JB059]